MISYYEYCSFKQTVTDQNSIGAEFCDYFGIDDELLRTETNNRKAITRIMQHYVDYPNRATRSDDIAR